MLTFFTHCRQAPGIRNHETPPVSKLKEYQSRTNNWRMPDSQKQAALNVLIELIKEYCHDGEPANNIAKVITPDDCVEILEKLHLKVDRKIKAELDVHQFKTITSCGPYPKIWARDKLLALHQFFSAQKENLPDSSFKSDLSWAEDIADIDADEIYSPRTASLNFSPSRKMYLNRMLADLVDDSASTPDGFSIDDYREILQDFHSSGALSECEKNQLDLANLKFVSRFSVYDNARAKSKVLALVRYFSGPQSSSSAQSVSRSSTVLSDTRFRLSQTSGFDSRSSCEESNFDSNRWIGKHGHFAIIEPDQSNQVITKITSKDMGPDKAIQLAKQAINMYKIPDFQPDNSEQVYKILSPVFHLKANCPSEIQDIVFRHIDAQLSGPAYESDRNEIHDIIHRLVTV